MRKLPNNFEKETDHALLESLQLFENFLLEASWTNTNRFKTHYDSHVLKEGETFNPSDPKFVHMTEAEYRGMAEQISEMPTDSAIYKTIYDKDGNIDRRIMNTRSNAVGFRLKPDVGKFSRVPRKAKIVITPQKYLPDGVSGNDFRTIVVYVDEYGENEIVSCFLLRPRKMFGIFNNQYDGEM